MDELRMSWVSESFTKCAIEKLTGASSESAGPSRFNGPTAHLTGLSEKVGSQFLSFRQTVFSLNGC